MLTSSVEFRFNETLLKLENLTGNIRGKDSRDGIEATLIYFDERPSLAQPRETACNKSGIVRPSPQT